MTECHIKTLVEHGKRIGEAARTGDELAREIIYWYESSHRILDPFGIVVAEMKAQEWVKLNPTTLPECTST